MKYALKVIIPLVLIVALLAVGCWYFLLYRTDVTTNILTYWGNHFYEAGRYHRAIVLYDKAQKLSPEDENIPIRLAQTYVLDGNYTKAEYTLVSAITDHPQKTALYLQLSQIYIAQDKLLDAELMLEHITNDDVRAELDALRPAAPIILPENGYYSDYIDVTIYAHSGTIYSVVNGDYPSLATDVYQGPFTLEGGETKIVAVAVGDNGLVSDAAYAGYTVGSVVEPVTIQDPAMSRYVHELLALPQSSEIMSDQLWEIEALEIPEDVADLSDLALFTGLHSLTLHRSANLDLTPIGSVTTLQELDLSGCTIPNALLERIGALPDLISLNLSGCALTGINPLVGLTGLLTLDLSNNTIDDITALSALTELKNLNLANNPLKSISYLNNCLKLEALNIENCGISKLSSIAGNAALHELHAANNTISDISVLEGCDNLSLIDINNNQVEDISVLAKLPALTIFYGSTNQIKAIPQFDAGSSQLWQFVADRNEIEDLSGLVGIQSLNVVVLDYNKVTAIEALKDCSTLIRLDIWDNPVPKEQVDALEEIGIIVNYNPNYVPPAEEETDA